MKIKVVWIIDFGSPRKLFKSLWPQKWNRINSKYEKKKVDPNQLKFNFGGAENAGDNK